MNDYTRAFKIIKQLLGAATKENFQGSHDPEGNAWLPLKRPRARGQKARAKIQKKIRGKGVYADEADKPLLDTGILRNTTAGAGNQGDGAEGGHIEQITPTSLTYGTNLYYAHFHQYGAPKANIPPRVFLGWNRHLLDEAKRILKEEAVRQLRARRR